MEPLIGQIIMFAGTFAPKGWAFCEGQLLPIFDNQPLFSILGTAYGGNGTTTFALPDLRGRVPIGPGTGPGLSKRSLGEHSGTEKNTMTTNNMPAHSHSAELTSAVANVAIPAYGDDTANSEEPDNKILAIPDAGGSNYIYSNEAPTTTLLPFTAPVNDSADGWYYC